ncbi:ferredoxin family protein [Pseudonocardia ailaonensis]|uniref:Ferredoxin n=1 Tax=Pseudonocardia ailaonensis TaxID=367279 RepID=A0ABN2NCT4_9PSEU
MTYVITAACVDVKDRTCLTQCPVDCIYEGERSLYIQADECIECGACEPVCPQEAIYHDAELPVDQLFALDSSAQFFSMVHPGRDAPLGKPGGSKPIGVVEGDSDAVAALPPGE